VDLGIDEALQKYRIGNISTKEMSLKVMPW
jgi:hypothetical protein